MPIEASLLRDAPSPLDCCPKCGDEPLRPFMRGQVQRGLIRTLWDAFKNRHDPLVPKFRYCAVICWGCKEIVGYE